MASKQAGLQAMAHTFFSCPEGEVYVYVYPVCFHCALGPVYTGL